MKKQAIGAIIKDLAIILILGLLLYDYVPMAKIVPEPVSYATSEEVKQELMESEAIDDSQIVMTYEIDSTDLNNYKRIQDYKPGKTNPFSTYETQGENPTENSSGNGNNTSSGNASANNNENTSSSGGTYFQNKGTK